MVVLPRLPGGLAVETALAPWWAAAADVEVLWMETLWVPVIHPCWSGGMPVLVEGAAEPVRSADIEARGPLWIGHRFRAAGTAVRRYGASGGAVLVIELLELPQRVQD